MKSKVNGTVIGVDLGKSTTGIARIHTVARIAEPLEPIAMSDQFITDLNSVVHKHYGSAVVIGMPRSLNGNDTEQTQWSQQMYEKIADALEVPVFTIDEAGTTKAAEARAHEGESIDSVAAGIIAEDFLREVAQGKIADVGL